MNYSKPTEKSTNIFINFRRFFLFGEFTNYLSMIAGKPFFSITPFPLRGFYPVPIFGLTRHQKLNTGVPSNNSIAISTLLILFIGYILLIFIDNSINFENKYHIMIIIVLNCKMDIYLVKKTLNKINGDNIRIQMWQPCF